MSNMPLPQSTPGLQTIPVQAALLRGVGQHLPGVGVVPDPLKVGQIVMARIGTDPDVGGPMLVLGGVRVSAQLPESVQIGQILRLQVAESTAQRVVLKIVADPQATASTAADAQASAVASSPGGGPAQQAAAVAPPYATLAMPGGGQVRMWLDPCDDGHADAEASPRPRTRTMVVRYDSPVLGRTDIVLRLEPDQLDATVLAARGTPLDLVRATVPDLRLALLGAVDRPVALQTGGRVPEDVDVRA